MRMCSLLVLVSLLGVVPGCSRRSTTYGSHSEPPMESEQRLTPEHNVMRLRVRIEPHWPEEPELRVGQWQTNDQLSAYVTLRWINLGPDPAPSVVELQAIGADASEPTAVLLRPNVDGSASMSSPIDFARCGTPCIMELEAAWHHAPTGELRIHWNVSANHNAYRSKPSASYNLAYAVESIEAVTSASAVAVAVSPEGASPEAASPEAASPEAASPEAVSPEAASPEVASPEG